MQIVQSRTFNHLSFHYFLTNTEMFYTAHSVVPVVSSSLHKLYTVFIASRIIGFSSTPEPGNTRQKHHHTHEPGFTSGSGPGSGSRSGVDSYISVICCPFTPFQILGVPLLSVVTPIQIISRAKVLMNSYS